MTSVLFSTPKSREKLEEDNYNALLDAAFRGDIDKATTLLAKHTPVNPDPQKCVSTPLFYAAQQGHLDMIALLIQHGAAVNQVSVKHQGKSALNIAVSNNHIRVVKYLLKNKADPNIVDEVGVNALDSALWHFKITSRDLDGIFQIIQLLVDAGVDKDINGISAKQRFEREKFYIASRCKMPDDREYQITRLQNMLLPVIAQEASISEDNVILESSITPSSLCLTPSPPDSSSPAQSSVGESKYSLFGTNSSTLPVADDDSDYVLVDRNEAVISQNVKTRPSSQHPGVGMFIASFRKFW